MMGLSTRGSISLGCALVAGRNRVPSPAAEITALRTFIAIMSRRFSAQASASSYSHDWSFDRRNAAWHSTVKLAVRINQLAGHQPEPPRVLPTRNAVGSTRHPLA